MGGDSAAVCNGTLGLHAGGKVFRRGEYLIGCSGSSRLCDLVRYVVALPDPTEDVDAGMVREFVPTVRSALADAGRVGKDEDGGDVAGGHILVGVRGRIYDIDTALAVIRDAAGYNAIGSGCEIALGVLYATEDKEPKDRIMLALKAAERWTTDVRGPFTVESL